MSINAPGLPSYLAEWYRAQMSSAEFEDAAGRLEAGVAAMCGEGVEVHLLMTLAIPTEEVLFGVFAAESAQPVSEACRRAGLPAERLTRTLARGPQTSRRNSGPRRVDVSDQSVRC